MSNALKCKIGFGLSSRTSDTVTYNYEDTTTDCTLGVASSSNPAVQPRGCYVSIFNQINLSYFFQLNFYFKEKSLETIRWRNLR